MPAFVPCEKEEFLWNIAYSEIDSQSRHGDCWRRELGDRLVALLGRGDPRALGDEDRVRLQEAFAKVRGRGYLAPLLELRPRWHRGLFEVHRLSEVRVINWEPFRRLAPHGLLGEFVQALDEGRDSSPDLFAERYRRLRPVFDPARVRGVPVLVAQGLEGPFLEVDGLTRMSILLSRRRKGETVPSEIDVMLGLTERLREWKWS